VLQPTAIPPLGNANFAAFSPDVLMTTRIDGQIILWDRRVHSQQHGVGKLELQEKTPPWCVSACWSSNGAEIYAGRRNATVDVYDIRMVGSADAPRHLKILRNPASSGAVCCVAAFPDGQNLVCASQDNIRLWNVNEDYESGRSRSIAPFKIIAGHHGGAISQILVDATSRFMITASGNRGWFGETTKTVLVHEMKHSE